FVADSSAARINDNLESWLDMGTALTEMNQPIGKIPLVVQYNKRDLADAVSVQSMHQSLGVGQFPEFEAVAFNGEGVFNTLKSIINDVIFQVQKELQ
ncbi:MAG: hypothetical protein ACD_35C00144G0001, partial [uncultured bacterium]